MKISINLNEPQILDKVQNERFGKYVSSEWKRLIDPFTPKDTGLLMGAIGQTVDILPFKLHYKEPYASAVYFNTRGVKFITQGAGRNPFATDHWDVKAEQAGQKNKLYRILNNALDNGQF